MMLPLPSAARVRAPIRTALCFCTLGVTMCVAELRAEGTTTVGLDLTVDGSIGLSGGLQQGKALHGLALVHSEWTSSGEETARPSWKAKISALGIAGRGPTGKFVGDVLTVSNAEGYESFRLYSSWVEFHGRHFECRTGLLLADEEFAYSDAGSNLMNASFGWPIFISANTVNTGPAFFAAGAGVRLRFQVSERSSLQFGLYDGDTFDSASGDPVINRDGLHYHLGGRDGWFSMVELSRQLTERTRWKIGGWLHTAHFPDMYFDRGGKSHALTGEDPRLHRGNGGIYAVLEKRLRGVADAAGNVDSYLRVGVSPSDRNVFGWALDCGATWQGLFAARPDDVLAMGFTHAHHSGRFRANAHDLDPNAHTPDFEEVVEISYRIKISDRLTVQPDLQHIRHPGGSRQLADATVFLMRVTACY